MRKETITEVVSEVTAFSSSMFVSTVGGLILNSAFNTLPIYMKVPLQIGNVCVGAYIGTKVGNFMGDETRVLLNEFTKLEKSIKNAQSVKVEG